MGVCEVCNGLKKTTVLCPKCGKRMNDKGRIADFYDDYSPYMEIDQLKMEDGFPTSFSNETCPHLYHCSSCSIDKMYLHKE